MPQDTDLTVVVRSSFEQELNRVVHVGAVVDVLRRPLVVDVRSHLNEFALGEIAPTYILVGKDVACLFKLVGGAQSLFVLIGLHKAQRYTVCD